MIVSAWLPGSSVLSRSAARRRARRLRRRLVTTTVTVTVTTTSTKTTTAPSPATTAIVVELQQVMTNLGYYDGPIDGVYGQGTTDGVKAMQTDLGVTADGDYGAETHNALKGKGGGVVASLQTELTTYGYYDGPIDGAYGRRRRTR